MPTNRRLAPLFLLVVAGILAAGCASTALPAPASSPPSAAPITPAASAVDPPPSAAVDGISVTVETTGGECLAGACGSTITIEPDGRVHQLKPEPADLGTVPGVILDALVTEIEQTDFDAIRGHPFTDTCPIAYDGQQIIYTFTLAARSERIDSCEVVVDPAHPLFIAVDAALAAVASR
jgi:hypothetical protein